MPINPIYNDIEMGTAWAEDAATTIPSVPVPGIAYRNTGLSEETVGTGQQYDSIGRSADWNELLYKISANIITLQRGGATLLWISGRQYEQGALVKDPNNAQIYYRLKAGAGTTRPSSDSTNWQLLQDLFCGEGLLVNTSSEGVQEITWGRPNTASTNPNTLIQSGVYWLHNQTTNIPTDIESSTGLFTGFIVALRIGLTTQQIAYEVNNSGSFSMNTRLSYNKGSSWTAWTRFGVNFTLDWNSGHDYRVGDLVRDTSNSLLYVCTTAISNSTQRPGLDTGHFALLQSYLAGEGLEVRNNKITWGVSGKYLMNIDVATLTTPGTYRIGVTNVENAAFNSNHSMMVFKFATNQVLQIAFISNTAFGPVAVRGIINLDAEPTVGVWNYSAVFDSLDFISGRTYDKGQLVRGSNNVHYVKKTAASVCTTEPNSDSTNFESLAKNLIGYGLTSYGNEIEWGWRNNSITDCNSIKQPGVYYAPTGTANVPYSSNGMLLVVSNGTGTDTSTAYFTQLFIGGAGNLQFWIRISSGGAADWNAWTKIGPAEEVSASDLAGNGLTAASNKLNWGTASNVTNANNVTTPGTYALTSSSTNTPTKNGIMFVVKKPDGTISQVIIDADTGKTYSRDKTGSDWSTWYSNTSSIGTPPGRYDRAFGTTYTAEADGYIMLTAYSNWRANTNGQLYVNNMEVAVNHTGQYGSGGQSSGVQTPVYIRAGDQYRCNQGSLEYYWWYTI